MIKTDVENYKSMVKTNEILENEIKLLENLSKNNGVKIAKLLHGPVQGKIAGVVLALRIYANNDKVVTDIDLDKIKTLLNSIDDDLDKIINPEKDLAHLDLIQALDSMKNNWKELIQVELIYDISFEASRLNSLSGNIVEVLNEAISNALRHGLAEKVEITLQYINSNLTMIIEDNGTGIKEKYAPGFGMAVYKENHFQHSITSGNTGGSVLKLSTKVSF
jgi:signal transduction histidine kinase